MKPERPNLNISLYNRIIKWLRFFRNKRKLFLTVSKVCLASFGQDSVRQYRSLLSVIFFFCLMIFETQNDQILFDWLLRHKQTNVTILVNGQLTHAI